MISKRYLFLTVAVVLSGIVASRLLAPLPAATQSPPLTSAINELPEPTGGSPHAEMAVPRFVGAGSCAGRACHGNPSPSSSLSSPASSSAYDVWVLQDPHARAYSVLFTAESQRIAKALRPNDPRPVNAWEEQRCLACHSLHVRDDELKAQPIALADGVSCEACHGPAQEWLAKHYLQNWPKPENYGLNDPHKMNNTKSAAVRAEICAGCHVGEPAHDGLPARDVNHDLIAAGHPRLTFEYAAYMAKLPRHWRDPKTTNSAAQFDEARLWTIGQVTAAKNRLDLLHARAESAARESAIPTKTASSPWPELSEYDCYACHHQIDPGKRRRGAVRTQISADANTIGLPGWDLWNFCGVRWLGGQHSAWREARLDACVQSLGQIRTEMNTFAPNLKQVTAAAQSGRDLLSPLQNSFDSTRNTPTAEQLLKAIRGYYTDHKPQSWDELAQAYLALVAINNVRRSEGMDNTQTTRIDEQLRELRKLLSFNQTPENTNREPESSGSLRILRPGVNSPDNFKLEKSQAAFEAVLSAM